MRMILTPSQAEDNIMKDKPRRTDESLFSKDLMMEILVLGFTITVIVFGVWKYMMDRNYDITYALCLPIKQYKRKK